MKKLITLLSLTILSCSSEQTPILNCHCDEQLFDVNTQQYLFSVPASDHKCKLWGLGDELLPNDSGSYLHRFKEVCE